jgi:P27 family predicted phage terminase small subunit
MGARGPIGKSAAGLKFTAGAPPAPAWLDATAKAEYERAVTELASIPDHIQQVDLAVLATYAQAYSDVCRLTKAVRREGDTVKSSKGTAYLNPKSIALASAHKRLQQASAKLGFSPVDRLRMTGKGKKGSGELDAFV